MYKIMRHLAEKLVEYEDLEEQCIKETTWSLRMLLKKWKEFFEDIRELYEYRKLEEQGLLLKLPCKVGDMFFCIWMNKGQNPIQKMQVKKIEIHERKGMVFQMEFVSNRGCLFRFYADDFGKTVFLTRAEAEEALRKMNGTEGER